MAAISASMVKDLREKTDAGMMDCKKALEATDCDFEKAVAWLREKGLAKAAKKAGRATSEGLVNSFVSPDGKTGVLVEVKCETDFVAKSDRFRLFVKELATQVAILAPKDDNLANAAYPESANAQEALGGVIGVLGENMQLGRFARFTLQGDGGFGVYIHSNNKLGVLVEFACAPAVAQNPGFAQVAKDVAMQVAAANPLCLTPDQIPADLLAKEMDIYKKQAMAEGKPEAIAEKIVLGRVSKFHKEVCLLDQAFIKDDKRSIAQLLKDSGKSLGGELRIVRFARLALGEDAQAGEEAAE